MSGEGELRLTVDVPLLPSLAAQVAGIAAAITGLGEQMERLMTEMSAESQQIADLAATVNTEAATVQTVADQLSTLITSLEEQNVDPAVVGQLRDAVGTLTASTTNLQAVAPPPAGG